jgi:hypothetical protein
VSGWTPGWQQDARALLSGEMTVEEATSRVTARRRPGAIHDSSNVVPAPSPYEPENPMLFGRQEMADTSTCTDLVLAPEVIWDVNGYYRDLQVPFPHRPVTRHSLMQAHRAAAGLDDRRKTYVLKQLLDEVTRGEYNSMPLGQPYIDDEWNEYFDRKAQIEALRRVAAGEIELDEAQDRSVTDEIKREWGLSLQGDEPPSTSPRTAPPSTVRLTWSYYLWRCSYASTIDCATRLDTWRTLLVDEFRDRAMHLRFRVGIMGKQPHPWLRVEQDGHLILFLNKDQEPTKEYAAQAAKMTQRELGIHTDTVMIEEASHGAA